MYKYVFEAAYFMAIKKILQTSVAKKMEYNEAVELFEKFRDAQYKTEVNDFNFGIANNSVITKICNSKKVDVILALDDIEINTDVSDCYNTVVVIGMKNVHIKHLVTSNLVVFGKDVCIDTTASAHKVMLAVAERCKYPDTVVDRMNEYVFVKYDHQIDTNLSCVMGFGTVVLNAFGITDNLKISYKIDEDRKADNVRVFSIIEDIVNDFKVYKPTEHVSDNKIELLRKIFPNKSDSELQMLIDEDNVKSLQEPFDSEIIKEDVLVVNNLSSVVITQAEEPVIVGEGGDAESSPTIVGEDIVK